ncbi:acyltransferase domain-containing protein [Eubacterium sp. ER2]|uniref:acyltransferase domain-containing protein n=1 Tax=Eubacterium sp. ER2 TaxID=1519438 RepID=UPI00051AE932|nr:acyltransferase domain-containing protein [Eubacterium sp. ER2]
MKILSPTQLTELCHSISLPPEITDAVLSIQSSKEFTDLLPQARPLLEELLTPATWDSALVRLKALIGEDPLGIKILTLMLICCGETWRSYQSLGISGDIYIETLKCFTRFINEHQESYGVFGFDRDFWTMRQLAARLFRLGTLEFELTEDGEGKAVHVHIPSDADLSPEARHRSYDMARDFIARFSPAYKGAPFLCTSWLLSPALRECLPKGSRIRSFQDEYEVTDVFSEPDSFLTWVYKRPDIPLPDLPEGTSLQRNLKKYLLAGGKVGEGKGRLLCKRI